MKTKGLDDIYTDFQAQQVAQENPNSFWSKFFIDPLEKFVVRIKKKKRVYSFAEKRVLVKNRKQKKTKKTPKKPI